MRFGDLGARASVLAVALSLVMSVACTSDTGTSGDVGTPSDGETATGGIEQEQGAGGKKRTVPEYKSFGGGGDLGPLATKRSSLGDGIGDHQTSGEIPGYTDILNAAVEGAGADGVRLILRLSGPIPETMPDERTSMIIAWNLSGSKKVPAGGFSAQATQEGWLVSSAQGSDVVEFPGTFEIDGATAIMTLPWDFIGGPRKFEWSAAASWFSSTDEEAPASAADNVTGGRYPG